MSTLFKSKDLQIFKNATSNLMNPAILDWKNNGGKIIGCMYHYIPEEIITAAGLMPYRMRATGSEGTEFSEADFTQINCSFVRHLFDTGIRGKLSFLDGVVSANHCDHLRRFYENWQRKIETPYMHFICLPKKKGVEQAEFYRAELVSFKNSLENEYDVTISDEMLTNAIKIHNKTRRLQRKLYELRKKDAPPISGADIHAVMVAASTMPKQTYNSLLTTLLQDLKDEEGAKSNQKRLMIVGGEIDDPQFIEVIESQGGIVVADSLGYGYRTSAADVKEIGDPMTNIANYQILERPACPRLFGTTFERNHQVKQLVEEYRVDGVISVRLPLCDEWSFEQVNLIKYLKKAEIPHLAIDIDYILNSVGQIKTRAQAFIETLTMT